MAKDVLSDLIRHVLEQAGVDVTIATRIEPSVRQAFGGERYYLARTMPEKKTATVGTGFALGMTARQIAEAYDLPLRTVFWHARRHVRRR